MIDKIMMRNKLSLLLVFLALPFVALAQTAGLTANDIKSDATYIYGDGWGNTYSTADQAALADLISKISVNISSSFELKADELNTNGELDSKSALNSVINSYAQGTLNNTGSILVGSEPQIHVMRYIKRDEINKIFDERKEKVFDYVRSAIRAEEKNKIDDALRDYYWALALVKSLQYPNQVKMRVDGAQRLLVTWIPQQIEDILSNLTVKVAEKKAMMLIFS